jgi:NAD(P)-dependent dehydrogenase (short-subunit alcohol dehydrogenase family)
VIVGRSPDKLQDASKALGSPPRVKVVAAEVTREDDVVRMFAEVGSCDHLVITRGVPPGAPIASFDLASAREFIEIMLVSAISLAKHSHGTLRAGGSMIFTSGISKDRPSIPGGSVVAAVAGSFGSFARALALELAPTRVNVVSPGWVDTPMWDELAGEGKKAIWEQIARRLPVGHIGSPVDIALAFVFLMESDFTTGTTLHVDGGHALI